MKHGVSTLLFALTGPHRPLMRSQALSTIRSCLGRQVFAQSCRHLPPATVAPASRPMALLNKARLPANDAVMRAFIVNGTDRMPAFKYYLNRRRSMQSSLM